MTFKQQLHGAHASSALRFAENAEQQQQMDIGDADSLPQPSRPAASSSQALAGRLAPEHGLPGSLTGHQVRVVHWTTPQPALHCWHIPCRYCICRTYNMTHLLEKPFIL